MNVLRVVLDESGVVFELTGDEVGDGESHEEVLPVTAPHVVCVEGIFLFEDVDRRVVLRDQVLELERREQESHINDDDGDEAASVGAHTLFAPHIEGGQRCPEHVHGQQHFGHPEEAFSLFGCFSRHSPCG
eukprot:CAMPEP_0170453014 /NCGR_PEP_ID=MMETSP0123-20130129/1733_1 /TAXON_ID=182087 /ORGANISM="Favella ehrenbergii, Strain Fehren 1" /LENGTH=130 /DNA_ID=CAMNT_0010715237 /DNA_START=1900 /DNA_END=2292 /DNA_ORIENTATION=+